MHNQDFVGIFRPRGAMVSAAFGALWLIVWWHQTHRASLAVLALIIALVTLVASAAIFQMRHFRAVEMKAPSAYRASRFRYYIVVNAICWPIFFIAVVTLGVSGHARWINPAIILLVGLHLFPLGRIFQDGLLHLAGVLLATLAVSYPPVVGPDSPVGLLGAGTILLATGAAAIVANGFARGSRRSPKHDSLDLKRRMKWGAQK